MIFFKDNFKKSRKAKKITYKKLSEQLGKSLNTIYNWEKGIHTPSLSDIFRLSEILNMPFAELTDQKSGSSVNPFYYDNLDNLDKSIFELSRKSESERQKIIIRLLNKEKILSEEITILKRKQSDSLALLNSLNHIIYKKDISLKYIYANQHFLDFFGLYDDFHIIGRRDSDIWINFNGWKELTNIEKLVLESKKEIENQIISIPKSFAVKNYGKLNIKPIFDKSYNITGLIGSISECTEDKAISDKFSYIESVLENLEHVIWIAKSSPYRHFIFINNAVNSIYKSEKYNFYNDVDFWLSYVHKDDYKKVKKEFQSSKNNVLQYKIELKDGSIKWINHFRNITEINGEEIEYSIIRDISAELNSKRLIELMSSSIDNMNEGFCLFSSSKNDHIFVNKAREKIYGYPLSYYQNQGAKFWFEKCLHPEDYNKELDYHINKSWPEIREFRIIKPDKSIRIIEARVTKFEYSGETFYSFFDRDITDKN